MLGEGSRRETERSENPFEEVEARDIKKSQSWQKFAPLRISYVKMSAGLHLVEPCETAIELSATHSRVAFSLCSM
jgi:hypothetical protein